jgi:hypothetical protein
MSVKQDKYLSSSTYRVSFNIKGGDDSSLDHRISFVCSGFFIPTDGQETTAFLQLGLSACRQLHSRLRLPDTEKMLAQVGSLHDAVLGSSRGELNRKALASVDNPFTPLLSNARVSGNVQSHDCGDITAHVATGSLNYTHDRFSMDIGLPAMEFAIHAKHGQGVTRALLILYPVQTGQMWMSSFLAQHPGPAPVVLARNNCVAVDLPTSCSHSDKRELIRIAHRAVLQSCLNGHGDMSVQIHHDKVLDFNIAVSSVLEKSEVCAKDTSVVSIAKVG